MDVNWSGNGTESEGNWSGFGLELDENARTIEGEQEGNWTETGRG